MFPGYSDYHSPDFGFIIESIGFPEALDIEDNNGVKYSTPQFKPATPKNLCGTVTGIPGAEEHWDYPLAFSAKAGNKIHVVMQLSLGDWLSTEEKAELTPVKAQNSRERPRFRCGWCGFRIPRKKRLPLVP